MTCGVTVALLITLLFFLVNRLRQRKTQAQEGQLSMDDQRSIESIGYIGGNIGYIGAGAMDYSYEHGTTHYQFWKPPGSYFTRRDAPPPYEEAIALAMTEPPSTCTVSVASSNFCQYPVALMEANTARNITASTTNLINININNGDNSTTLASGENHSCRNESDSNLLTRTAGVHLTDDIKTNHELNMSFPSTINYNITAGTSNICTNQNCDLRTLNVNQDRRSNQKEVRTCTSATNPCSSRTTLLRSEFGERIAGLENMGTNTVISVAKNDDIKSIIENLAEPSVELHSSGKRYHRTIPKHFSYEDQIQSTIKNTRTKITSKVNKGSGASDYANKNNYMNLPLNGVKRLSCQCPVKHTPMSKVASYTIGLEQAPMTEFDSSDKEASSMKNSFKQTTYRTSKKNVLSNHEAVCRSKQCQPLHSPRSKGNSAKNPKNSDESVENYFSNGDYSKQHFENETTAAKENSPENNYNNNKSKSFSVENTNHDSIIAGVDLSMNITVVQRNTSTSIEELQTHKKPTPLCLEQNPELPPKQYKYHGVSSRVNQNSYYSNSKIHTISKPTKDNAKFSIHAEDELKSVHKSSEKYFTKSLPRKNITSNVELNKNYNPHKSSAQVQNSSEKKSTNSKFNTLSKEFNKSKGRCSNAFIVSGNRGDGMLITDGILLTTSVIIF